VTATQSAGETDSDLRRLHAAAKKDAHLHFTNLLHFVTPARLRQAFFALNRKAARGIDEQSWTSYEEEGLNAKLSDLHRRIHTGRYRPLPSKRLWIPKANGQQRPIGIAAIEDKIVQQALVWILQEIYEADFMGFSYGFRPGRGQHQALDAVYMAITTKKVSWILDADIQGFFDQLNHEWLIQFIRHRIHDKRLLDIVIRTLRAGVSEDGQRTSTRVGTPQGAVISPLLANIYLHYVLDLWAHQWRKRHARGEMYIVRYADDFVIGFQYEHDGKAFHQALQNRLQQFGLKLHPDKTRLIEFGRFAVQNRAEKQLGKPESFQFLGFTHLCEKRKASQSFQLIRQSIAKRQRLTLDKIKTSLLEKSWMHVNDLGRWLRSVVQGYYNYFGVPGNKASLESFRSEICRSWHKVLRRRGNKKPTTWRRIRELIRCWIPSTRIVHPFPNQRWRV
jgi:RNA-directed DNA polymerase